ncbi:hypothetical protein R84B8_01214 [Treponema sp. R8-4-B8]
MQSSIENNKEDNKLLLNRQIKGLIGFLNNKDLSKTALDEDFELISYMSTTMINANPEKALQTFLTDTGQVGVVLVFLDPIRYITYSAVYDKIIKPLKDKRTLKVELAFEPEENNFGGYTVMLLINNFMFKTEWVKEYGTYRLNDFYQDNGKLNHKRIYATRFPIGKTLRYSFISKSDVAWYRIDVPKAGNLKAETTGNLDTRITLYDNEGKKIIEDDDSGRNHNALINTKVVPGTFFLEIKQFADNNTKTGEYGFTVSLE